MNKIYTWNRGGALGDVIATLQLLDLFREQYEPKEIHYRCHTSVKEVIWPILQAAGFNSVLTGDQYPKGTEFKMIGYPTPLNPANPGNHPHEPMKKHLIKYFADDLGLSSNSFASGLPSLKLKKPAFNVATPFVTLQYRAGWSAYKNWFPEHWNLLVTKLKNEHIPVVQIGGADEPKFNDSYAQIKGPIPSSVFSTCLAALANARVHVGVDSWANHATNIIWEVVDLGYRKTPGVILWGSSQISATGYPQNRNITKNLHCQPCFKEDPGFSDTPLEPCNNPPNQVYSSPNHRCMTAITVNEVFDKVVQEWELNSQDNSRELNQ